MLKAAITSIFGTVLKIDSTKKVCTKLQGSAGQTAAWATNVGNERGEVLMSVLTESESAMGLEMMAEGLMDRYRKAEQEPPYIIYTDRDCCNIEGQSKIHRLFSRWESVQVRLDVWHFMRRIALGVTSESYPLYATFMSKLSGCIFEWDGSDYNLLLSAKRSQLIMAGLDSPTQSAVKNAISAEELSKHCRRRTRGTEAIVDAIEALLLSLAQATDSIGVPLLKDEMTSIWEEQKHHVPCLQDPPGIALYTGVREIKKGSVELPVLRCAHGSTSLESFHLHLARFIPGTSAGAVNFQAYLLDGITRWNAACAQEALDVTEPTLCTFYVRLQNTANQLSQKMAIPPIFPHFQLPMEYTGELFGVEYLYNQTGTELATDNLDDRIDEGFVDVRTEASWRSSCMLQYQTAMVMRFQR